MQEVGHQLQTMKELAEAQKECFRIEIEELREQVQEMEMKSAKLEKELGLFKAKEQKLGKRLGRGTLEMKKSQAQPIGQQDRENSAEPIEKDVHNAQIPISEKAPPAPQLSSTNPPIRNYASVTTSEPAQTPEHPWTQVIYKSRKTNAQKSARPAAKIEHQGRRILFPREVTENQSEKG